MKKNLIFKIISAFICTVLLVSAFSVCVGAEDESFVEWEMSETGWYIESSNGKIYHLYDEIDNIHLKLYPLNVYCYANTVYMPDEVFAESLRYHVNNWSVFSYEKDGEYIWISDGTINLFYSTEAGEEMIDDFMGGVGESYYISIGNEVWSIDTELYNGLCNIHYLVFSEHVAVSSLADCIYGELVGLNSNSSLAFEYGCIYKTDEKYYYYLDYSDVDDIGAWLFDDNGDLRYNDPTKVPVYQITEDLLADLLDAEKNSEARYTHTTYEDEEYFYSEALFTYPIEVFWVMFALVGVVAPLSVVGVGVILSNSKKRGYPKHWMAAAIAATVWLLLSFIVLLLLLI